MSPNNEPTNAAPPVVANTPAAADPLRIHRRASIVDMHAATVPRMIDENTDINQRLARNLDVLRAFVSGAAGA